MESVKESRPPSIAIIGGGIGGLCLAAALSGHNVSIHVYEAAQTFSEVGAGVGLGPNALRAMELLNPAVFQGYKRCETTNLASSEQDRFFNFRYGMKQPSSDGKCAGDLILDLRSGCQTSSVHRARFLDELVNLMPNSAASLGKRLTGLDCQDLQVILRFSDQTEASADAVIGCDGIKSEVRKILLRDDPKAQEATFSGKICYRGLVSAEKAIKSLGEDLALSSQMYLGHKGHVLITPIEHGKTINVVAYCTSKSGKWEDTLWIKSSTKSEMLDMFKGFCEPVMEILGFIEKIEVWALFDQPPAATYHSGGQICLLGDAAHATTPHHGAGAGMAVEDALVLSKLLASINTCEEIKPAFAAYDSVQRPRTQRLVASSRALGAIYDLEDPFFGDDMKAMQQYLSHAWDWIWHLDLESHLQNAFATLEKLKGSGKK